MSDQHMKREIAIFNAFANVSALPIIPSSIKKMCPPKPDIECEIKGSGVVAFELVEILDCHYMGLLKKEVETKKILDQYRDSLSSEEKKLFYNSYSNAQIVIRFQNGCTLNQRKDSLPKIFDYLLSLNSSFEGRTLDSLDRFKGKLIGINILRTESEGGCFPVIFAQSFGNPAVDRIESKFHKKYDCRSPIHLLAYLDVQPRIANNVWIEPVKEYLKTSLQDSRFEKVWIFDCQDNEIKFH